MVYIPATVPTTFLNMYLPAFYAALIVAFIGLTGIAIEKETFKF